MAAAISIIFITFLFFIIINSNIKRKEQKEQQLLLEEERDRFISSDNYIYLKNFVKKYKTILPDNIYKYYIFMKRNSHKPLNIFTVLTTDLSSVPEYINAIDIDHITKLQTLINSKGFNFSIKDMCSLIDIEKHIQEYDDFKTKMLFNDPKDLESYIKNLIEIYGENYKKYTQFLIKLLKEKGVAFDEGSLTQYINDIKNKIELEHYEQELESGELSFVSIEELDSFTGYEFERFLNVLFKKMGYSVESTKLSGDQGADLIISKLGEKVILQAKRHKAKIGNKAVQEVVASIKHYNANKGMVVTNNYFTNSAIELAESNNIELIDRDMLSKLIEKYL